MYKQVATPGERILQALADAGMKQADLIRLTGVNSGSLSCWISGKYEPKQEALYKMGRALDVSEMWLAGYDVPRERPAEQKENDAIADITQRLRRDPDFRALIEDTCKLTPEQIKLLRQLVNQMTGRPE